MSDVDTSDGKRRRNKRWPESLKREIVAATFEPGASVSVVARRYDVNANQVFAWRRRYLATERQPALPSPPSMPTFVPMTINPEPEGDPTAPPARAVLEALHIIEIEVPDGCRIRVGSDFDGRALKRVLDLLRKR
jgi:transposase